MMILNLQPNFDALREVTDSNLMLKLCKNSDVDHDGQKSDDMQNETQVDVSCEHSPFAEKCELV